MNLEEVSEFSTVVPVIDDGDICGNAEHKATAQALANRTKYLRDRVDPMYELATGAKSSVAVTLASMTADVAAVPFPNESTPFNSTNPAGVMGRGLGRWIKKAHESILGLTGQDHTFEFSPMQLFAPASETFWNTELDSPGLETCLRQNTVSTVAVRLALPLPGITGFIKEIGVFVRGASGHGALPATKPRVRLIRPFVQAGAVTETELAALDDPSATVGAYEAIHAITLTGLSVPLHPVAPTLWTMWLRVTGESGANSQTDFGIGWLYMKVGANP